MADNEEKIVKEEETNYVEAINELKANTVPKEKYEKLQKENKELLDALVNNNQIETPETKKTLTDQELSDLIEKTYSVNSNLSDLEYMTNTLKLREAMMERGYQDPFAPEKPGNAKPTEAELEIAQNCAEAFQEMVEESEGNSELFHALYQKTVYDANPLAGLKRK